MLRKNGNVDILKDPALLQLAKDVRDDLSSMPETQWPWGDKLFHLWLINVEYWLSEFAVSFIPNTARNGPNRGFFSDPEKKRISELYLQYGFLELVCISQFMVAQPQSGRLEMGTMPQKE